MKRKITLVSVLFFVLHFMYAQNINIHSITANRMPNGDVGYTLDGIHMTESRAKLKDSLNFGPAGTYAKTISIVDGYINSDDLQTIGDSTIDLFFFGMFNTSNTSLNPFTAQELDTLYNWSLRGGKLIICGGSPVPAAAFTPDVLNSRWGFDLALLAPTTILPTTAGSNSKVFKGPFGVIWTANEGGGSQGYFSTYPSNALILADDGAGNPTLYLDCNTLDLVIADGDAYTDLGGVTAGSTITADNDILWANSIAYMDSMEGPPVITMSGGILSTGTYASYQWYLNGNPITGATSYSFAPTQGGSYSVHVPLACGCTNVSSLSVTYVGVDELSSELFISISPNPAANQIKFENSKFRIERINISDALGQKIIERYAEPGNPHQVIVDVSALTHGIYFVTIKDENNGLVTRKIVKM